MISIFSTGRRRIFLLDGLGAFITAALLFFVLRNLNDFNGIPGATLTYLAAIALVFCMYSIGCFCFLRKNYRPFLLTIIIANILYCLLTIGIMVIHASDITALAIIYFVAESIIISMLVFFEISQLKRM